MSQQRLGYFLAVVISISFFLSGCYGFGYKSHEVAGIALDQSLFEGGYPNVQGIVLDVEERIHEKLPGASLADLGFQGKCEDLPTLWGAIHLLFVQEERLLWSTRYFVALATVNVSDQTLDLAYQDWSAHPLSSKYVKLDNGISMQEAAELAGSHLQELKVNECDITLTHFGETWNVLCTVSGSDAVGHRLCHFQVDIRSGKIIFVQ